METNAKIMRKKQHSATKSNATASPSTKINNNTARANYQKTKAGTFCDICKCHVSDSGDQHKDTQQHRFAFAIWAWNHYKKALVKDRNGIQITAEPVLINDLHLTDFSADSIKGNYVLEVTPHQMLLHCNTLEISFKILNQRKDSIILTWARTILTDHNFKSYDPSGVLERDKFPQLLPGAEYMINVRFHLDELILSSFKVPIGFNFQTTSSEPDTFSIVRSVNVVIRDAVEETVSEISPFTNKNWTNVTDIIECTQKNRYSDDYEIPEEYRLLFLNALTEFPGMTQNQYQKLLELRRQMEPGYVTPGNYLNFFRNLVWLEEMGQTAGLENYNMENVTVRVSEKAVELDVPGLAEKRPSLVTGDYIQIRLHNDHTAYEGVVKRVLDKSIIIYYLNESFLEYLKKHPDLELDVRFQLNRLQLERMHLGITQIYSMINVLFPTVNSVNLNAPIRHQLLDNQFADQTIPRNPQQRMAVVKIVNHTSNPAPYIVYGPPGTGKTVTIVEAIYQLKRTSDKRILVCAPANAACDMLAQKLAPLCQKGELIRICAENIDVKSVPKDVIACSNMNEEGIFHKHSAKELMRYRIVITTLILIGRYRNKYMPDVVFIDEAAQAREPEVAIAVGMVREGKQIVLAGDPNQLGPSCSSRPAEKLGLGRSLLERLMDLQLYKSNNSNFITMLKLNFRSHELILRLPNQLFYGGQLEARSFAAQSDPLSKVFVFHQIDELSRKVRKKQMRNLPGEAIEFCGILAKEKREGQSPSYFNIMEMQMVVKYVKTLLNLNLPGDNAVTQTDIGVVTPYIRQVYKIKDLLSRNAYADVEVGTTETFQGREKRVIIISTVRGQHDLLLIDKKYNLGFVRHKQRFNVALTRAKTKLIVIGNPQVLGTDDKWVQFIELCEEMNVYAGARFVRRSGQDFMYDVTAGMKNISMKEQK